MEQGHYPYGEAWYAVNTTTKFLFTSYQRDSESGNDYAMARFYINRFGRFACADPIEGTPSDPQSWNRYAYVRNDPVNMTDPSGLSWLSKLFRFIVAIIAKIFHIPWLSKLAGVPTVNVPMGRPGTPPTFPSGEGMDWHTLIFGRPDLSKAVIVNWSPQAHDQLIWNALHLCGVSNADIWQIQRGSRWFDEISQGEQFSNAHAMRIGTGQSADAAIRGQRSFMMGHLRMASGQLNAGERSQAMFTFGIAMHPPMDQSSPAHTDSQGDPISWCGIGFAGAGCGDYQPRQHSPDETSLAASFNPGIERVADLNAHPEVQRRMSSIIRSWFEQLTGQRLNCSGE